jgi:prefoldin subunit 5
LLAAAADHVHPGIGEISMSRKAPAMNVLIPAGYGAYVPRSLEVSSGVAVEVGVGATLEIG